MAITNKIGNFLLSLISPTTKYVGQQNEKMKELQKDKVKRADYLKDVTNFLPVINMLKDKQGQKAAANIASFMVPLGKGSNLATKALVPGAVSGGLAAGAQENASTGSVLGGAVLGGATAGVLTKLPGLLQKLGLKTKGAVVQPKVRSGFGAKPTSELEKQELVKAAQKFGLKGSAANQLEQLGNIYNRLKTNLDDAIKGVTRKFNGTKLVEDAVNKAKLQTDVTKGVSKTNMDFWSKKLAGVSTADDIAKLKFELSGQLNRAYTKIEMGNPLSASEKVMLAFHDVVDDALKSSSKNVSNILKEMATTHKLAPGLLSASEKAQTLRPLGIPTGISIKAPIQGITDITSGLLTKTGGGMDAIGKILSPAKQAGIPTLIQSLSGGQPEQPSDMQEPVQQGLPKDGDLSPQGQWKWSEQAKDWVANEAQGGGGQDTETIKKAIQIAMLQDLQTGGKNISELNTILSTIDSVGGSEGTQTEREKSSLAKSGVRNLDTVERILISDPKILTKQLIPGKFASREFDAAMYDSIDSLLKLRTGATSNEQEIRGYMDSIAPRFGDSPEVAKAKLAQIRADFASYIK